MSNKFKVSLIIPVYNVEEYIKETMDSIISQDFSDLEIILVDDGSTDKSGEIIKEYAKQHNNIVYILQENSGPSRARNRGIKEANGKYIIFMDSDDILPKDSIKIRYDLAEEKNAEVVVCATYKFDGEKKWPMTNHFLEEGYKDIKKDYDLLWTLGPCNKLFKADLIKNINFPEKIKYAEDQVFVMGAYLKANKIYATKKVGYYYRVRNNPTESLTQQIHTNSVNVLEQVRNSWISSRDEIDSNIENKFVARDLKIAYFSRLVSVDIWPPLKNAIIGRNEKIQLQAFEKFEKILDTLEKDVFNELDVLKWVLFKGVIDKYLFLTRKSRKEYIKVLKKAYDNMTLESIYKFNQNYNDYLKLIEKAIKRNNNLSIYSFLAKRKLSKKSGTIKNIINKCIYKVVFNASKIMPLKTNKVILASNKSQWLSGNLKSIYDELIRTDDKYNIKIYMKDYDNTFTRNVKMYYNFATAKYIILDDYYRQLYGLKFKHNAEIVQVWHACGAFKKFGFSSIGKKDSNPIEFERRAHSHYTKVITSSKDINKHYAEAFNADIKNVIPLGVPRTDILLNPEYKEYIKNKLESDYPSIVGKKVITYAPTFRGGPQERKNFKLKLDPVKILNELGDEYVVILKLHPSVQNGLSDMVEIPEQLKGRVLNFDSKIDINEVIMITDVLISDYSSVVFEGALLEKNILMYAYDKDAYLGERDFYYDYDDFVPGPIAYSNDDIIRIIKNNEFSREQILNFRDRFFDYNDGKASQRFVEYIFNK